jgi:F-type H+-transporting ATPase subunit alpha
VISIYAGVNGYLDALPVNKVRAFEDGLLRMMRDRHADVLDSIRTEKTISDATGKALKSAVEAYAKAFA